MKVLRMILVSVITTVAILFTGCGGAVSSSTADPVETESPDPNAQLLGAWYRSEIEIDSGGREERNEIVLTLTPERYIYHVTEFDEKGEFESAQYWSGEWAADETTVTTTTRWWDRDARKWSEIATYEKSYTLTADELEIDLWNVQYPADETGQETYTRQPRISDITGTWYSEWNWEDGDSVFYANSTIRISDTKLRQQRSVYRDNLLIENWYIDGDVTIDYSLNYIHLKITDHEVILEDFPDLRQDPAFTNHTVRYAFAQTFDENKIVVSNYWGERRYVSEENTWIERTHYPWGEYGNLYSKQ